MTGWVLTGAFCGRRANGGVNNRKSYYRLYFGASFDRAFSPSAPGTTARSHPARRPPPEARTTPPAPTARNAAPAAASASTRRRQRCPHAARRLVRQPRPAPRTNLAPENRRRHARVARRRPRTRPTAPGATASSAPITRRRRHPPPRAPDLLHRALPRPHCSPNLISDADRRYMGHATARCTRSAGRSGRSTAPSPAGTSYRVRRSNCSRSWSPPSPARTSPSRSTNFAQQNGGVWDRWLHGQRAAPMS
ncbi:hypothetical protein ACRAWF_13020 [Streptomyces sp. L7]